MSDIVSLTKDKKSIEYLCKKDKRLAKVIEMVGEYTYKPYEDSFQFLVNQIIGQMLSSKVAVKISERLENACNQSIEPEIVLKITEEDMRAMGMSVNKARAIKNLALEIINGNIFFEQFSKLDDNSIIRELTKLKGIGVWTAKMYLIFVLDRQDILPYEDMAFLQSYSWMYKTSDLKRKSIEKKCKKWKPYTSIGARYLYKALDLGLTKQEFHLYKN